MADMVLVAGLCPSCGGNTLFIGTGGHVTCSLLGCKDPCAADTLLHRGAEPKASTASEASVSSASRLLTERDAERPPSNDFRRREYLYRSKGHPVDVERYADVIVALEAAEAALAARDAERRRVPGDEGGTGREEQYWMRAKCDAAITHLRDMEDYFRLRGGLPEGFNMLRADRARQLHEAISAYLLNGKRGVPTVRERADAADTALRARDAELAEAYRQTVLVQHARRLEVHKMFDDVAAAIGYTGKDWEACVRDATRLREALERVEAVTAYRQERDWAKEITEIARVALSGGGAANKPGDDAAA